VSDVQEKVTDDHFPIIGSVLGEQGEWTVVQFKNPNSPNNMFLNIEVSIGQEVSCVLEQVGFTNDQRDTIMEIFTNTMFA
jgi:hypothetical protein